MKYIAILNTDKPLTECMIQAIKDTSFCGDDQATYVFEIEKVLNMVEAHGLAEEAKQMAIKDLEQESKWISMIRREPTAEEKAEYLAQNGEELCYMLENKMPTNGQEVLVSIGKFVSADIFNEEFYNFENHDIENVDAWMPLPDSYEKESEGEK